MDTGKQKWIETQQEIKKKVKNGDSEGFSNSLPHLSHDIIINDILTRVPVDSLMRFRCVCKLWSNLIVNDSKFVSLHLSRTYSDRGFIWLFNSDKDLNSYSLRSNGVVFYDIEKKEKKVFHFRPENVTSYSIKLPVLQDIAHVRTYHEFDLRLAYDSIMKKYKVFCIHYANGLRTLNDQYFFKILTLGIESDPWRDVVVSEFYPRLHHDGSFQPRFASGSFYWLTHDTRVIYSSDDQRKILAFDISREKFYTIRYPKGALNDSNLLEIDGSVCFLDYVSMGKLKLWVLKEDKEEMNNQHREYEWVEKYNVDDMPNLRCMKPTPIVGVQRLPSARCCEIVTNPTVKIIFWAYRAPDEVDREFCSYDIQLRRSDSIFKMTDVSYHWHLNCLANL